MHNQKSSMKEHLIRIPTAFAFGLFVGVCVFSVQAYAQSGFPAPANPPNNNAAAPLNVSYSPQWKLGNLRIEGLVSSGVSETNGLLVINGNVGFGTAEPATKLDVDGTVTIRGGVPGPGKVLTSLDVDGTAVWATSTGGSIDVTDYAYFPITVPRNSTATYTTSIPYSYCALSRLGPDYANSDRPDSYCSIDRNTNGTWRIHGRRADDPDFICGMTCFQLGTGGGSTGGGSTPQGTFTVVSGSNTVQSSGVSLPYTATVIGAAVGDAVVVALKSNYYYGPGNTGGPTGLASPNDYYNGQNSSFATERNVCGAVTATVSSADTVKVNFWNNYEGTNCTIPAGTYTVKVIR